MQPNVPATPAPATGTVANAAALPNEQLLQLLVGLLRKKPETAIEVAKRAAAGRSITVKGIEVGSALLSEALRQHKAGMAPGTAAAAPAPSGAAPLAAGGSAVPSNGNPPAAAPAASAAQNVRRYEPPPTSTAALASRVLTECENAEPFCCQVTVAGGNKVAVLTKPNVTAMVTGEYVQAGETVDVIARFLSPRDGRVYLRLKRYAGWVSTRSRKDFSKVVLAAAEGAKGSLEPPSVAASLRSHAVKLLRPLDAEGRDPTQPAGEEVSDASRPEPVQFQALSSRCQIHSVPTMSGQSTCLGASMRAKEDFLADGVYVNLQEGRAYLRLCDGRGWVAERLRSDFARYAVIPSAEVPEATNQGSSPKAKTPRGGAPAKGGFAAEIKAAQDKLRKGRTNGNEADPSEMLASDIRETPRPLKQDRIVSGWVCPSCQTVNEEDDDFCSVCFCDRTAAQQKAEPAKEAEQPKEAEQAKPTEEAEQAKSAEKAEQDVEMEAEPAEGVKEVEMEQQALEAEQAEADDAEELEEEEQEADGTEVVTPLKRPSAATAGVKKDIAKSGAKAKAKGKGKAKGLVLKRPAARK
mmetsp:Transcript_97848/g.276805  ORF Transcript_97848/g.276805 Transcript_97848/m.276805 type:complete len:580 (-) Transcript_97848:184-1923(-)